MSLSCSPERRTSRLDTREFFERAGSTAPESSGDPHGRRRSHRPGRHICAAVPDLRHAIGIDYAAVSRAASEGRFIDLLRVLPLMRHEVDTQVEAMGEVAAKKW